MQRAMSPHLFETAGANRPMNAAAVLDAIARAYPEHRISGVDGPTTRRPTALAYVTRGDEFVAVLADPADGRLLGELPQESAIAWLQELHFDLLAGRTGRIVNGIGGFALLAMCLTGLVIWWPGTGSWRRGLTIDVTRGWKRINWDLHGALGFWTAAMLAMWAVTGVYFAFPSAFRSVVDGVSPLTSERPPASDVSMRDRPAPGWHRLIETARREVPDGVLVRVILPSSEEAPFRLEFAGEIPLPVGPTAVRTIYLDQYTGAVLPAPPASGRSVGDVVMTWVSPLHVGGFGGTAVKVLWAALGLAPPLLFVTGFAMWWNRVCVPRRTRDAARPSQASGLRPQAPGLGQDSARKASGLKPDTALRPEA
jgi:uncharacterized iron-regulated membrane protein